MLTTKVKLIYILVVIPYHVNSDTGIMSISLIHSGTVLDVVQECLSGQDCDACAYGYEFTELFVVRIDAESQIYLLQVRQEVWKCWGIQESYENSRPERTRIYIAFPLPKTSSQKVTN